jgi:hypothetical protein
MWRVIEGVREWLARRRREAAEARRFMRMLAIPPKEELIQLALYSTSGATRLIDRDVSGDLFEFHALSRSPFRIRFARRFVIVENGTKGPNGRAERYLLWVPTETRTAREGVAWTYGLKESEYERVERT